jgi:hypothetical protein
MESRGNTLQEIESSLCKMKETANEMEKTKPSSGDEMELNLWIEQHISLESEIQKLEEMRDNLIQWNEYVSQCKHDFVLDLIDVDPDKSSVVEYCKHCLFIPNSDQNKNDK